MVGDYFQCWTAAIQFSCALYLSTAKQVRSFNHACVMDGLGESCLTMLNSLESWFCEGAMACTRWNKCWCVWWNDLSRNQWIHARGIPVRWTFSQWQSTYQKILSCSNLVHENHSDDLMTQCYFKLESSLLTWIVFPQGAQGGQAEISLSTWWILLGCSSEVSFSKCLKVCSTQNKGNNLVFFVK
jgi:hypothetical protein